MSARVPSVGRMMLTKESNGYDEARLGFQRLDPHRPEVVFAVTSTAEVQEAVEYAAGGANALAVQASGHGLIRGNNGGVLIATRTSTEYASTHSKRRPGSRPARPGSR